MTRAMLILWRSRQNHFNIKHWIYPWSKRRYAYGQRDM